MRAIRVLTSLFFLVYLTPGPLLHELIGHEDSCDVHAAPPGAEQICPEHHHCELCHFEGPSFIEPVYIHGFSEQLKDQQSAARLIEDHSVTGYGSLTNRGPPVNHEA